jgi:hypothetical protein
MQTGDGSADFPRMGWIRAHARDLSGNTSLLTHIQIRVILVYHSDKQELSRAPLQWQSGKM